MLKTLLLLLLVSVGYASWQAYEQGWFVAPCEKPIAYSLGTFDQRFNLSQADFLSVIGEAEQIWEKSLGKELFIHSPNKSKLTVNLIYDHRQEVTEELTHLEGEVKQDEVAYKSLQSEYQALKARHVQLEAAYESRVEAFNQHNVEYEQMVEAWNASPRTSKSQFQKLESEQKSLEAELAQLKSLEVELNTVVKNLNSLVSRLNRLAKDLNLNVEEYNTVGASRGESFAGGIYSSDKTGEKIDIYEFSSRAKLVRVLAHELGHALGLDHLDDPQAIMYTYNQGSKSALAESDIAALKTLCSTN